MVYLAWVFYANVRCHHKNERNGWWEEDAFPLPIQHVQWTVQSVFVLKYQFLCPNRILQYREYHHDIDECFMTLSQMSWHWMTSDEARWCMHDPLIWYPRFFPSPRNWKHLWRICAWFQNHCLVFRRYVCDGPNTWGRKKYLLVVKNSLNSHSLFWEKSQLSSAGRAADL